MSATTRYQKSNALAATAARYDAWISAELSNPARHNYQFINGLYPLYGSHAQGAYLWDIDGNRYIDYNLGYGTIVLGHCHTGVTAAVQQEVGRGHCMSPLWKPQQSELCELICSVVPNVEQAFLMKTGSDASSGAIRLARLFTGRSRVVRWGYNGWHDWSTPRPAGVPESTRELVHTFAYNDLQAVEGLFSRHGSEIACVFMMPFEVDAPEPGFLEGVKRIAHAHGALFILDEMRSGFRLALGGAQEFFKLDADLVTFSKAMANGYPISCIAGRADILKGIGQTKITATYFTSADAMAAALVCIRTLQTEPVIERIWSLGRRLLAGLAEANDREGGVASVRGYPPYPYLEFDKLTPAQNDFAKQTFFAATAREGLFLHPSHHWYICAAHTQADVDETIAICGRALHETCEQL